MTDMDDCLETMGNAWRRQALEHLISPEKGRAAGYTPKKQQYAMTSEIDTPANYARVSSMYAAWLRAILTRDCPSSILWTVCDMMGEEERPVFFRLATSEEQWTAVSQRLFPNGI